VLRNARVDASAGALTDNNGSPRLAIAVAGGLGSGGAMRRRAAESILLGQLRRPHRFHAGDEVSELVCGGASGAKMITLGVTLSLAVPVPGFALIGGLAGAMLAAPSVQLLVVRYVRNHCIQRLCMISPNGSEDLRLTVDLASKGHSAFVQSAIYSLEAGDWSLSGVGTRETLTLRQRDELTNRCIGIVEDNFALEPILDMRFRAASTRSASLEEYGKESEAAAATSSSGSGGDGTGVAAAAGTGSGGGGGGGLGRRYQLVCTQKIFVGPAVLSMTRRTYRFEAESDDDSSLGGAEAEKTKQKVGGGARDEQGVREEEKVGTAAAAAPPPPSP